MLIFMLISVNFLISLVLSRSRKLFLMEISACLCTLHSAQKLNVSIHFVKSLDEFEKRRQWPF